MNNNQQIGTIIKKIHGTSNIPCINIQNYGFSEWSIIKIDELIKHVLSDNISQIEDSISIVFIDFIKRYELVENNELDKLEGCQLPTT